MATSKIKKPKSPKITDAERHARFVETARKIGASEDTRDFEKAFGKVVSKRLTRKS
jgi:hypothetical protein